MIAVQLNRADFEYDIHSLVKAFFPSEEVSVGTAAKETKEEISFHIVTDYLEDAIDIRFLPGKKTAGKQTLRQVIEVDFSNRKETKNRLKRAYYQMLCEYTGRTLPWGSLTGIRPVRIPLSGRGKRRGVYPPLYERDVSGFGGENQPEH